MTTMIPALLRCGLIAAVFVVSVTISAPLWAADVVGTVKALAGLVTVERDQRLSNLDLGAKIYQSDTVRTAGNGSIGIVFEDDSMLSAGPNSVLVIKQFEFNPTTHKGRFVTEILDGTLSVISGKIAAENPEAMKLKTPETILGVRGTQLFIRVDGRRH